MDPVDNVCCGSNALARGVPQSCATPVRTDPSLPPLPPQSLVPLRRAAPLLPLCSRSMSQTCSLRKGAVHTVGVPAERSAWKVTDVQSRNVLLPRTQLASEALAPLPWKLARPRSRMFINLRSS
eukprot:gene8633-biopygen4216